ncbi:MAG: ABC transporter ATP-binding protein [Desulfurococcales archaeon]|nr:ABC transporter ATP-binding protein [Desulfurococcales archaeon]
MDTILSVKDLSVYYYTLSGVVRAVDNVSFELGKGEWMSLVGESGSGKSTLGFALLRLVPPPGRIVSGKIILGGTGVTNLPEGDMRKIRGSKISMVLQDPLTSLDPLRKIGEQLEEILEVHDIKDDAEKEHRIKEAMRNVGLPYDYIEYYPHQLSGGQRQRIAIASSIILNPSILVADEPTTALDVIVQSKIMDLLDDLRRNLGISIILITHDLALALERSDKIAVMYAGEIVEEASGKSIASDPLHPYTKGLINSIPRLYGPKNIEEIPGFPPDLRDPPPGCRFHPRCKYAMDVCKEKSPDYRMIDGRKVRCWLYSKREDGEN